jgi:hypothetical protein
MQEDISTELGTAIILAVDDLFRRKFKAPVCDTRKIIPCQELYRNPNVSRLMLTQRPTAKLTQGQAFAGIVKTALKQHPLYSVVSCGQQGRTEKVEVIRRRCQF